MNTEQLAEKGKKDARTKIVITSVGGVHITRGEFEVALCEAQAPLIAAIKEKDDEIERLQKEKTFWVGTMKKSGREIPKCIDNHNHQWKKGKERFTESGICARCGFDYFDMDYRKGSE